MRCAACVQAVQELVGHYIALEEYNMIRNVQLAVTIDERRDDSLTSSMVDEVCACVLSVRVLCALRAWWAACGVRSHSQVFYVLKKCTERALFTCSVHAACAIVNHINAALSRYFLGAGRLTD